MYQSWPLYQPLGVQSVRTIAGRQIRGRLTELDSMFSIWEPLISASFCVPQVACGTHVWLHPGSFEHHHNLDSPVQLGCSPCTRCCRKDRRHLLIYCPNYQLWMPFLSIRDIL